MGAKFEVGFTGVLRGTPEQVWDAITVNTGGWLWPIAYEPRVGGKADDGMDGAVVTDWEPHRRFANHAEREDGWFNTLTHQLTPVEDGTLLEYTHRGVHEGDYDTEQAACAAHTAFYFHTLGEYVAHFPGRTATYVSADATETGPTFTAALAALGLADAAEGDEVRVTAPDGTLFEGVVDYRSAEFLGIRTADSLLRFFGRDTWGWPVGIAWHAFGADVDAETSAAAWRRWLS